MFVVPVHRLSPSARIPSTVAIVVHMCVYVLIKPYTSAVIKHMYVTAVTIYTSTLFAISCALRFAILFALSRVENSSSARFFSYSCFSLSVDL